MQSCSLVGGDEHAPSLSNKTRRCATTASSRHSIRYFIQPRISLERTWRKRREYPLSSTLDYKSDPSAGRWPGMKRQLSDNQRKALAPLEAGGTSGCAERRAVRNLCTCCYFWVNNWALGNATGVGLARAPRSKKHVTAYMRPREDSGPTC